jgi:hypothetical protein
MPPNNPKIPLKIPPKPQLLAVLLNLSIATAFATTPKALEMDKDGVISIVTDAIWADLEDLFQPELAK